jgi:quercetin dioxygenase-like cupin family protein
MDKPYLIVPPEDRPSPLDVAGMAITVLAGGDKSGSYEVFHQVGPQGAGAGPHRHPWGEAFCVISGAIGCGVDGVETVAGQGAFMQVPPGRLHPLVQVR